MERFSTFGFAIQNPHLQAEVNPKRGAPVLLQTKAACVDLLWITLSKSKGADFLLNLVYIFFNTLSPQGILHKLLAPRDSQQGSLDITQKHLAPKRIYSISHSIVPFTHQKPEERI